MRLKKSLIKLIINRIHVWTQECPFKGSEEKSHQKESYILK